MATKHPIKTGYPEAQDFAVKLTQLGGAVHAFTVVSYSFSGAVDTAFRRFRLTHKRAAVVSALATRLSRK